MLSFVYPTTCIKHFLVILEAIKCKMDIDSGTDLGYGSSSSPPQTNTDFTDEDNISLGDISQMSQNTVIENPNRYVFQILGFFGIEYKAYYCKSKSIFSHHALLISLHFHFSSLFLRRPPFFVRQRCAALTRKKGNTFGQNRRKQR